MFPLHDIDQHCLLTWHSICWPEARTGNGYPNAKPLNVYIEESMVIDY